LNVYVLRTLRTQEFKTRFYFENDWNYKNVLLKMSIIYMYFLV